MSKLSGTADGHTAPSSPGYLQAFLAQAVGVERDWREGIAFAKHCASMEDGRFFALQVEGAQMKCFMKFMCSCSHNLCIPLHTFANQINLCLESI